MTLSTSSPRAKQRWALLGAVVVALTVLGAMSALAINATGAFELDGNATNNAAVAGDDWDNVCHEVLGSDCSTSSDTNGATAVSWLAESDPSASIFTGGGSKDPEDPQDSWLWKDDGGLPDKDNLLHGFAARYSLTPNATTCPAGSFPTCEVIFFGSDRFANDGDAVQGFWFFQNKIEKTNTAAGGGFKFTGHHKNGDLLIISDFSNGGSVSTIFVHKWDSTCSKAANNNPQPNQCSAANLRLLASSTAANCISSAATAGFCGIVNTSETPVTSPWSFLDKDGNTAFRQGEFFEGGVNLSTLGLGGECFASVASETRSSTSPTATLKDFVLDSFGECTSGIVTTPKDGAGANIPAGGLSITTAGSISVKDSAALTVSGSTSFTGTLDFHLCKVDTGNCSTGGTAIAAATGVNPVTANGTYSSAAATITSAGRYCWRSNFTSGTTGVPNAVEPQPTDTTSTSECFVVNPVQPTISTTATSSVVLGNALDDTATLSGTANQPGSPVINPSTAGVAAGGTITFKLYGPSATAVCTDPATGVPGNLIGTSVVPVSGDSSASNLYKASDGTITGTLTPTAVGSYYWIASYSGNLPNTLSVAGTCGATGETSTVTGSASLATAQRWLPNDTAHVTSPSGTTLAGTLTFTLYNDGTCGPHGAGTGTAQYGPVTKNVVTDANAGGTANDRFVSTTNSTFVVTTANDATAWSWWVDYDDASLNDPTGTCESTAPAFTLSD